MACLRHLLNQGARNVLEPAASFLGTQFTVPTRGQANAAAAKESAWKTLKDEGFNVNPCGSWYHPSVREGLRPVEKEKSLQEAYTPASTSFGCGPAAGAHGLHLRSFRSKDNGLEAIMQFSDKYTSFPDVVSGGIISTALDCHGNWCAAVTLMDDACLPWPPLTVTYNINLTYREPTPPNTPLLLVAKTSDVSRPSDIRAKTTVTVDLAMYKEMEDGKRELLVSGTGIYKRLGAIKAF